MAIEAEEILRCSSLVAGHQKMLFRLTLSNAPKTSKSELMEKLFEPLSLLFHFYFTLNSLLRFYFAPVSLAAALLESIECFSGLIERLIETKLSNTSEADWHSKVTHFPLMVDFEEARVRTLLFFCSSLKACNLNVQNWILLEAGEAR